MKKSNLILVSGLIAVSFFFLAFQSIMHRYMDKTHIVEVAYDFVSEMRNVTGFRKVSVSHGIKVFFKQDSTTQIKVEAPQNLISFIKTEVTNEELVIEKTKRIKVKDSVIVFISSPELNELNMSSTAYFETKGIVSGKDLKLTLSGESIVVLELSYESVQCKASDKSKVKLKGNTDKMDFSN